jgi:hypothetical protein
MIFICYGLDTLSADPAISSYVAGTVTGFKQGTARDAESSHTCHFASNTMIRIIRIFNS